MDKLSIINDSREFNEFNGYTFSKFKKTAVINKLIECLQSNKIEESINWSVELICAGHFVELWESINEFVTRYIHLGNPRLPIYVMMRFNQFKSIVSENTDTDLKLRNVSKIRKLFAEIIYVLCFSKKKQALDKTFVQKNTDFNIEPMSHRMKAPNVEFISDVFNDDDPKEFLIAMNEFAYNISYKIKNNLDACYWLEWVFDFESTCAKKKCNYKTSPREFAPVDVKYKGDIIWIIWEIIMKECSARDNVLLTKIIDSIMRMFSIRYSPTIKRHRRFNIYFAILLLTEHFDASLQITSDTEVLSHMIDNIDIVYKQLITNYSKKIVTGIYI